MRAVWLLVGLLVPWAGCAGTAEDTAREIEGPVGGYAPTNVFLKLEVRREDGTTVMLDFDRADWYTAEIARRVDTKRLDHIAARAVPREVFFEYLVLEVERPADLEDLRYDKMGASASSRQDMQAEHGEMMERWKERGRASGSAIVPRLGAG